MYATVKPLIKKRLVMIVCGEIKMVLYFLLEAIYRVVETIVAGNHESS